MLKIIALKKQEIPGKIELFDRKKILEKGYFKSESYDGIFNKQGFELMPLEKSQKFLNNLWDNEEFEIDYNLMRFELAWHMNLGCNIFSTIEESTPLFRYALTKKRPYKSLSDNDDTILRFKEYSLIFPVKNLVVKGEFYLGPMLPEIENFKIYRGKERLEQLKILYDGNKNLEKIILNYLKGIKATIF